MARIEWVKQRLHNWALYKERESGGGLGFATQSVLLAEPSSGYRESIIPIDDVDADLTDRAVQALRPVREHLYLTLCCIYLRDMGIKGTARHTCKAESTVHAHLDQADIALSAWFGERAEAKKKSFTP
ncbi:hypothetical protein [Polaromonas sp. CG_23.6]|uniref:hypothetical protein n=1 Tax=Polaromonas sp. CG_23.6 TaxID=2760709 RepID=UPI0024759059|nr:hypothetical protein [Polaromonas sp. CG_23.6]MDH6185494.1 hypothetical protein [Polaromonas sp. CG_23.6]